MTAKKLKLYYGINEEKIDNGYKVPKTLQYTKENSKAVIEIDKDNLYGIKCYVMTINGKLAENFFNKTLFWDSLEEAKSDMIRIFMNQMPVNCHTLA